MDPLNTDDSVSTKKVLINWVICLPQIGLVVWVWLIMVVEDPPDAPACPGQLIFLPCPMNLKAHVLNEESFVTMKKMFYIFHQLQAFMLYCLELFPKIYIWGNFNKFWHGKNVGMEAI